MTNEQIIFENKMNLLKEGKIKPTGRMLKIMVNDEEQEIPEPESIHTFQMWKSLGYSVKKGEKAIAKFTIWKYTEGKKKEQTEEQAQAEGHCFLKSACFFSASQVEKIEKVG